MSTKMTEKKSENNYPILKYVVLLFLLMITPTLAIKLTKYFRAVEDTKTPTSIDESKINDAIKNYIKNHPNELLQAVTSAYYEQSNQPNSEERINNAIMFFDKILFDTKLPKILSEKNHASNIALIFSDFDTVLGILEEINTYPERLKVNFFFRQLITQNKISGIIARYGYAVYKIEPKFYLPFYTSILRIPKKDLDEKSINLVLKKFELNLEEVKKIANESETEKIILSNNELVNQLNIDQLPAFIFENGRIVFGHRGFESVKRLMYDN